MSERPGSPLDHLSASEILSMGTSQLLSLSTSASLADKSLKESLRPPPLHSHASNTLAADLDDSILDMSHEDIMQVDAFVHHSCQESVNWACSVFAIIYPDILKALWLLQAV